MAQRKKRKNPAAVALGRKGGKKSQSKLTPEQRADLARKGAEARWGKTPPTIERNIRSLANTLRRMKRLAPDQDVSRVEAFIAKAEAFLEAGDFRSADLRCQEALEWITSTVKERLNLVLGQERGDE